ncbi:FAD-dependent oxidoreductase [Eggerthella sp. YY7918]|uniref:FAD-dependent oxidoreductase n=1 Tax=Eggerthella sp. (strain YY7918) TaxID=502558 RepID=UPI00021716E7|nr:FAD-dependent oxidoreductase [Eggerthella sp. YY7918]BAK43937.1 succinate dehydrogenase [Eggerthella sp. YY7918]
MAEITRRSFLLGAAGATGAALAIGLAGQTAFAASKEALEQADYENNVDEEISCDILVIGGGLTGVCAAVQAGENGDDVLIIEAQAAMGGNGLGVECTCGYGLHPNTASTPLGEIISYEVKSQAYAINPLFYRDLLENAGKNIEWLMSNGVEYQPTEEISEEYLTMYKEGRYRAEYSFEFVYKDGAAGVGYFPAMKKKLKEYGARLRLNTRGRQLFLDENGNVAGAYATDNYDDVIKINAKAVIIGTGGFGEDKDRMGLLGVNLDEIRFIGTPGHYGDGINMAINAGGIWHGQPALGCTNIIGSAEPWGGIWDHLCWGGPSLWVDINGERFSDEAVSTYTHNMELQNVPVRLNGGSCWSIMDQSVLDAMIDGDTETLDTWNSMIADGDDAYKADTINALADIIGLDKDILNATIEEYNEQARKGRDDVYGKDPQYLMELATPPFYAARISSVLEGSYAGGVKTDRWFRVKKPGRDLAFENLFAIGADGAMLWNNVYGLDINGSMSCNGFYSARTAANTAHAYITGK